MKIKILLVLLCINGLTFGSSIKQSSQIDDTGTPSTENEFPMQEEVVDVTEEFMKKYGVAASK